MDASFPIRALMFDDIDLFTMLQLVARVVADSLGNFCQNSPAAGRLPSHRSDAGIHARSEDFLMRPVDAGYIPTPR
jgi:hypothetical protein